MADFLLNALLAGLALALVAGPLGSFVVWRRMAYFGDTLSHAALLGVALGFLLDVSPTLAVTVGCVLLAVLLVTLQQRQPLAADTLLGILAHSTLSLGLVTLSFMKEVRVDLMAYLFGDLLAVSASDLLWIIAGSALVLALICFLWRPLLAITVHEELAKVEGLPVGAIRLALMLLIAIVIAVAMKIVGVLLITSLLIIPAAAAQRHARSPEQSQPAGTGRGVRRPGPVLVQGYPRRPLDRGQRRRPVPAEFCPAPPHGVESGDFLTKREPAGMMSSFFRLLSILAAALLVSACQGNASSQPTPVVAPQAQPADPYAELQETLAAGKLEQAEQQWLALRSAAAGDERVEAFRRQLAEAYMQRGETALRQGDLNTATSALGHARGLMPKAPALTAGLDGAINRAKVDPARAEQARRMQQAAQQQMQQIIQTPPDGELKPLPGAPHLIDPQAASSAVPLPMLDGTGQGGLGAVLDAVAADVVAYRCRVHIEVRRDSDYPLVSDQLLARVKKLSPDFDLHLSHVVQADKPTRLILTPRN